jgi:hypothetical protein
MPPDSSPPARLDRDQVFDLASRAAAAGEELDLSGLDLSGLDLSGEGVIWRRVVFGRHRGPAPALLRGTSFRCSKLEECLFAHVDLTDADFRGCEIARCDMRYALFCRTTLGDATVVRSDFYRASFQEGTVMLNTNLELVSLTTDLAGAEDLAWTTFDARTRPPALILEDEAAYRDFLQPTRGDRLPDYDIDAAIADRFRDAAHIYRLLCGLWTERGKFTDANEAYAHCRRLEREEVGPRHHFDPFKWLWLWLADLICGFGQDLGRIALWLLAVALLPGVLYAIFGGVSGAVDIGDYLLFSASQLTASTPARFAPTSSLVEWVRVLQTLLGVGLLGLFGFVLGNKIRYS